MPILSGGGRYPRHCSEGEDFFGSLPAVTPLGTGRGLSGIQMLHLQQRWSDAMEIRLTVDLRRAVVAVATLALGLGLGAASSMKTPVRGSEATQPSAAERGLLDRVAALERFAPPLGTVVAFAGDPKNVPENWLPCDGRSLEVKDYQPLFLVIGRIFGGTENAGTFALPDLRGRAIFGQGLGAGLKSRELGTLGGFETHVLAVNELPVHNHDILVHDGTGLFPVYAAQGGGGAGYLARPNKELPNANPNTGSRPWTITSTGSGKPFDLMPPFRVLVFIIKAK
jgi:microcystin-dependent protein